MGQKNNHEIVFSPKENPVELDENSIETLSNQLSAFLQKEYLNAIIRESNAQEIRAKYNCDSETFQGGPSFVLSRAPNDTKESSTEEKPYWDLYIAQGSSKFVEMGLNRKGEIQDIQHNFDESGYNTEIISGWFEGVFTSIEVAKDRHAFTWEIKY